MTSTARKPWQTAIAEFTPNGISVRGYNGAPARKP